LIEVHTAKTGSFFKKAWSLDSADLIYLLPRSRRIVAIWLGHLRLTVVVSRRRSAATASPFASVSRKILCAGSRQSDAVVALLSSHVLFERLVKVLTTKN